MSQGLASVEVDCTSVSGKTDKFNGCGGNWASRCLHNFSLSMLKAQLLRSIGIGHLRFDITTSFLQEIINDQKESE